MGGRGPVRGRGRDLRASAFGGPSTTRPFAINSVAKDVVFCAVTAAVAADLRRRARLLWLVIAGHLVIVSLLALSVIFGDTAMSFPPPRWLAHLLPWTDLPAGSRALIWLIGAAIAVAALIWLLHRALRWASLDIGYKLRLRLALWAVMLVPLLFLRPPLPVMERGARRRFIGRRYIKDVGARRDLGPLRSTVQSAIRFVMQLVYMGY